MAWLHKTRPWYADGLAFECTGCGHCCSGPEEGYVWVNAEEVRAAAQFLGLSDEAFYRQYTRRVGARVSLIEQENADCIFLRTASDGTRRCTIYSARPVQCRTWPFWSVNLSSPRAWARAGEKCPGLNRGSLFDLTHIENERDRTTHG